ncbi:6-phosphogluconolactonase [Rhodothalassium salexigens DSM 2132]|uniref:6-phosphogluconolactonase n=1 Tax=Rhodothalassium salexigens DSM 2132 TaxID=1188247 RepID=A0A4R2PPG9_RHOSA|nr:6-phosphogluconolactonase [Rhodothalassium salexigens]MBB4210802.1 6-phosphogluconolactonase [Rhodothalassium salexigens DSM 2132]MBK1639135.1 6-phosphogluconolactonase [Rhodothalassium salexigens DSM 2132]TCP37643.1 6-phosphogluconolactonase [Rhodothalassium salexigens DSM 2132]
MAAARRQFASRKDLFQTLRETVLDRLRHRLDADGRASLVCAGGSTPRMLYPKLSDAKIDWANVWVTVSDERLVPAHHDASNEKMVRLRLLQDRASEAQFVPLISTERHPRDAEQAVEAGLATMPQPFAVTLLGMGTDGHTASLFPGDPDLKRGLDPETEHNVKAVILKTPPADAPFPRITMTARALLNSDLVIVLIVGEDKRAVIDRAIAGEAVDEMPIRAILHQNRANVEVFWAP